MILMSRRFAVRVCMFVIAFALVGGTASGIAPRHAHAAGTVGDGTPESCTDAAFGSALANGGFILFNCGASPVSIPISAKIVTRDTTINGGGLVTLSGGGTNRIFDVSNGAQLRLRNMTLSDALQSAVVVASGSSLVLSSTTLTNNTGVNAGAIDSGGRVTIADSVISHNTSRSTTLRGAGAILSDGIDSELIIVRSRIIGNVGHSAGGMIITGSGAISDTTIAENRGGSSGGAIIDSRSSGVTNQITNSTFENNQTLKGSGGGLLAAISGGSTLLVSTSTFRGNEAQFGGGLFVRGYRASIVNSTFADNRAREGGGLSAYLARIYNTSIVGNRAESGGGISGNDTSFANTVVAGNSAPNAPDCLGPIRSLGYNLIGDATGCSIAGDSVGNQVGVDAMMSTVGDYGGPTATSRPLPGSPAIDAGHNSVPGSSDRACATTDQRGVGRPIGDRCDIGAFEAESRIGPTTEATTDWPPSASGWFGGQVTVIFQAFASDGIESITYSAAGARNIAETTVLGSSTSFVISANNQGRTIVTYFATDQNGTTETPRQLEIRIDDTRPTVDSLGVGIVENSAIDSSTIAASIDWSADDDRSGVMRYELWISRGTTSPKLMPLRTNLTTTVTHRFVVGESYRIQIRAFDEAGNSTTRTTYFSTTARQESYPAIEYAYGWPASYVSGAYGGRVRLASSSAASATLAFGATSTVAWVSTVGPNRGLAEVWINGAKVRTVDLYAPTQQAAQVVFVAEGLLTADNTIEVRPTGTRNDASSGYRVDVDAFVLR